MLLNVIERNGRGHSIWNELDKLQDEFSRSFFTGGGATQNYYNPPINIYVKEDDVLLTALVAGYEPENIELSIIENTVLLKGSAKKIEQAVDVEIHRQEIVNKDFERSIELPFRVDAERVNAKFKNGILSVILPKAEADKPKKISVQFEN